jgi:hypothetical protein
MIVAFGTATGALPAWAARLLGYAPLAGTGGRTPASHHVAPIDHCHPITDHPNLVRVWNNMRKQLPSKHDMISIVQPERLEL